MVTFISESSLQATPAPRMTSRAPSYLSDTIRVSRTLIINTLLIYYCFYSQSVATTIVEHEFPGSIPGLGEVVLVLFPFGNSQLQPEGCETVTNNFAKCLYQTDVIEEGLNFVTRLDYKPHHKRRHHHNITPVIPERLGRGVPNSTPTFRQLCFFLSPM